MGKLSDGTVFADHQADDNLLRFLVGEGEHYTTAGMLFSNTDHSCS